MAAASLSVGVPAEVTLSATAGNRRRVEFNAPHQHLELFHATAELYVELVDEADESASGSSVLTIPAGTIWSRYIGRGEVAVSSDTSAPDVVMVSSYRGLL